MKEMWKFFRAVQCRGERKLFTEQIEDLIFALSRCLHYIHTNKAAGGSSINDVSA